MPLQTELEKHLPRPVSWGQAAKCCFSRIRILRLNLGLIDQSVATAYAYFSTIQPFLHLKGFIAMTSAVTIRVDNDPKAEVAELFDDIGLNVTTAITCFLKKCVDTGAIPFTLARQKRSAREGTPAAFDEAKRVAHDPNAPRCTDISNLHDFLLS